MNDKEIIATLKAVNHTINKETRYVEDKVKFNQPDFWTVANGSGDCEDYALAKRKRLRELGVKCYLVVCHLPDKSGHCVLASDVGKTTFILDNNFDHLLTYNQCKSEGWRFRWRQMRDENGIGHSSWVSAEEPKE